MTKNEDRGPDKGRNHDDDRERGRGHDDDHGHGSRDEVILDVATPKGPWRGGFPGKTTIAEVIKTIVKDLGLENESFQLVRDGAPLEPTSNSLASFGLKGKVKLALVATGSGV